MSVKLFCCECKTEMWLPDDLYSAAKKSPSISFYCAYGHRQHFPKGESEADKLRRERDLYKQRVEQWKDEADDLRRQKESAERQAAARKGQITRLKNRAAAGVCPCCTRSFENLRRHMASKHPTFKAEEVA